MNDNQLKPPNLIGLDDIKADLMTLDAAKRSLDAIKLSMDEAEVDILLVDDRPEKLLALETLLDGLHLNIIKASSGRDALRLLLKDDFALILLDVNMPGLDGLETAKLIRQRKNSENTPIIFMTAVIESEVQKAMGYELGAVDYIFSPIVPEVLRAKVSVFVELYKKTAQIRQLNLKLQENASRLELSNYDLMAELSESSRLTAILKKSHDELEVRVEERTAEISKMNEELCQANDELKRMNQIKTDFTSIVTHELRTPLASIKECIDMVLEGIDGPITASQRETLTNGKANADRLARIIQSVLDYSKYESGKMVIKTKDVVMADLLTEVFTLMNPIALKKGITIDLGLIDKKFTVPCDADKIRQLMINVVDNAIKFTPKSGKIFLRFNQQQDSAQIEVEDTGVGIKESELVNIFEMFNKGSQTSIPNQGGAGVGLAVCKLIVQQHGGSISVRSEPGKGSIFTISLPLKRKPIAS